MVARQKLRSSKRDDIIDVAMRGQLLPEYHFDWMDSFKAGYTDLVISSLSDNFSPESSSPELILRVADARLKFDSLDEDAVLMKCRACISMGKAGTAKAVFEHFIDEYKTVMGEQFGTGFSEFLKKISVNSFINSLANAVTVILMCCFGKTTLMSLSACLPKSRAVLCRVLLP